MCVWMFTANFNYLNPLDGTINSSAKYANLTVRSVSYVLLEHIHIIHVSCNEA